MRHLNTSSTGRAGRRLAGDPKPEKGNGLFPTPDQESLQ